MKKYTLIFFCLAISLFIYLFYRTEKTVVVDWFVAFFSIEKYNVLKDFFTTKIHLHQLIIYSLPEGLWTFCITLTSINKFLKIKSYKLDLMYLPLIFTIGLEILQLLHFTNGRFDVWDIIFSVLFWGFAVIIGKQKTAQNIFKPFNLESFICILSYLIVYLSYVLR